MFCHVIVDAQYNDIQVPRSRLLPLVHLTVSLHLRRRHERTQSRSKEHSVVRGITSLLWSNYLEFTSGIKRFKALLGVIQTFEFPWKNTPQHALWGLTLSRA